VNDRGLRERGPPPPVFLEVFILKEFKCCVLEVRILKGLRVYFSQVRILKELVTKLNGELWPANFGRNRAVTLEEFPSLGFHKTCVKELREQGAASLRRRALPRAGERAWRGPNIENGSRRNDPLSTTYLEY